MVSVWDILKYCSKEQLIDLANTLNQFGLEVDTTLDTLTLRSHINTLLRSHPEECKKIRGFEQCVFDSDPQGKGSRPGTPILGAQALPPFTQPTLVQPSLVETTELLKMTRDALEAVKIQTQMNAKEKKHVTNHEYSFLKRAQVKKLKINPETDLITLSQIDSLLTRFDLSGASALSVIEDLCEEEARTWFQAHRNRWKVYTDFETDFIKTYRPKHLDLDLKNIMMNTRQEENESCETYISNLLLLNTRMTKPYPVPELIEILYRNLTVKIKTVMGIKDTSFETVMDLEVACKEAENILGISKTSNKSNNEIAIDSLSKTGCFNCNDFRHRHKECPKARTIFCSGCGKKGVVAQQCCYKPNQASGSKSIMSSSQPTKRDEDIDKLTKMIAALTEKVDLLTQQQNERNPTKSTKSSTSINAIEEVSEEPNVEEVGKDIHLLSSHVDQAEGNRLYLTGVIKGMEVKFLIDTGCSDVVMQSNVWDIFQTMGIFVKPISGAATVANGNKVAIRGVAYPTINFGSNSWRGPVYLIKDLPYAAVLGISALKALDAKIDVCKRTILLSGSKSSDVPEELKLLSIAAMSCSATDGDFIEEDLPFTEMKEDIEENDNIHPHPLMSKTQKKKFDKFLKDWKKKFASCTGQMKGKKMKLYVDPSLPPVKKRSFPLNPTMQAEMQKQIDQLLEAGIIKRSDSPWSSPAFLIKKKNGEWRLIIDYRDTNKRCRKNSHPLPDIPTTLNTLKKAKFVSTLDMQSGYYQIPMDEASQEITAFSIPGIGHFEFVVMPFGLSTAPGIFQASMEDILRPVLNKHTKIFIDDIGVSSETFEEHMEHLNEVFELLYAANVKINWAKCKFLQEYTEFLGFIVGQGELRVSPKKIETVVNFPRPDSTKKLKSFLSLLNWLRRFIPNLSSRASCLYDMLKKGEKFIWTDQRNKAFQDLKECLVKPPILKTPDFDYDFEIHTDASHYGLSGVLMQKIDDEYCIIAYTSKTLSKTERNYSVTDKECYAVIHSVETFKSYIQGRPTLIYTDHSSLQWLNNIKNPVGRLSRWLTRLSMYDLRIVHKKGKENIVPDVLSRAFGDPDDSNSKVINVDVLDLNLPDVPNFTKSKDLWYNNLKEKVSQNPKLYPMFIVRDDLLYKFMKNPVSDELEIKLVVPTNYRHDFLKYFHDSLVGAHLGMKKTVQKLSQKYYWPKMSRDVKFYCSKCHICQKYKSRNSLSPGEMTVKPITNIEPFAYCTLDLIGPLPMTTAKSRFIVVIVDVATKWLFAEPIKAATAHNLIEVVERHLVLQHGAPKKILTDNGSQMTSSAFKEYAKSRGIELNFTPLYFPSANLTERYNRVIKCTLSMFAKTHRTWDVQLPYVVFALRTAMSEVTGFTPAKLLYGRELRQLFDADTSKPIYEPFNPDLQSKKLQKDLNEIYDLAVKSINKAKESQQKVYNLRHKPFEFKPGTRVWRQNFSKSSAADYETQKLKPKFIGPYVIRSKESATQYILEDEKGAEKGRWHVSHLRPVV